MSFSPAVERRMSRGMPNRDANVRAWGGPIDLPLVAAIAAMPLVIVIANVPSHLLMPAVAALAFLIAAVTAAFGWVMRADNRAGIATIWDFSGACALVGGAAGIFSEPLQVAQFFGAVIAAP